MRLGFVGAIVLGGCLYLGGINHAPEGEIQVDNPDPKTGEEVTLFADISDQDGDEVRYEWRVEVLTVDQQKIVMTLDRSEETAVGPTTAPEGYLVAKAEDLSIIGIPVLYRGHYQVTLRAVDGLGADRIIQTSFEAKNQPPEKLEIVLDVDPEFKFFDHWPDTGFTGGEERLPVHTHFMAWLQKDPAEKNDHEGDLECGKRATVSWTLESPDRSLLEYWDDEVPCKENELAGKLRFRLDADSVDASVQVSIKADVDDGYGGKATATKTIDLVANRPACIVMGPDGTGTTPPVRGGELRVPVLASEGYLFEVSWPDDDVNEGYTYTWLVRDPGRQFEPVQQGIEEAAFQMAPWFRMPGQEVELRVVIQDGYGEFPACDPEAVLCQEPGVDLPVECYQWATWRVEFL